MNNLAINTHAQLMVRIMELKAEKLQQEAELKTSFDNFVGSFDILSVFSGKSNKVNNPTLEFAKSGLNTIVNLAIDLAVGKHRSIKGFLSATLIQKFTSAFINNHLMNLLPTVRSIVKPKTQYERSQEFTE